MAGPEGLETRSAGEPKPLEGPIVDELLLFLPGKLGLTPEDLIGNPDVRILEDKEDPDAETLGASSLQALRAMNAVETRWGFRVPDDQLSSFRTFRSIFERVQIELTAKQ